MTDRRPAHWRPSRRVGPRSRRGAASLAELVLVSWLLALILLAVARIAAGQGRLARHVRERTRSAEALRTASVVLGAELRYLAGPDVPVRGVDSLGLRATRGGGAVCAAGSDDVVVTYRGTRRPEPDKDSVILISPGGTAGTVHALLAVAADARCPGGVRLRTAPGPEPEAVFALVFEPGTYHVNGGALRYRRGRAGRQPLSEAVFATGRFAHYPYGGTRLDVSLRADSLATVRRRAHVVSLPALNPWSP